jgi:Fic family protein
MQKTQRMKLYIHQNDNWPNFTWKSDELIGLISEVRNLQGRLIGKMESLGFQLQNEAMLDTLTLDVLKSSEIEGEFLDLNEVRSSIARRLGIEIAGAIDSERNTDGVVEMMLDATQNCFQPLTKDRLFDWHAALFQTGRSGMYKIVVGDWRKDTTGPMQVISGAMGKERIHFEAVNSEIIEKEMSHFLDWFNSETTMDFLLKAAVAHIWFLTIHPFEDGNGRIARALTDMLLAHSDKSNQRFYSMSAQIRIERKNYYELLEKTQKGNLDITNWITWFLECLKNALDNSTVLLERILVKAQFWRKYQTTSFNERQRKLVNKMLDGIDGKMTSSKWAKMAKCSKDSAVRDINELMNLRILTKEAAGGRSTNYELVRELLTN